jgi:hypothetical protein
VAAATRGACSMSAMDGQCVPLGTHAEVHARRRDRFGRGSARCHPRPKPHPALAGTQVPVAERHRRYGNPARARGPPAGVCRRRNGTQAPGAPARARPPLSSGWIPTATSIGSAPPDGVLRRPSLAPKPRRHGGRVTAAVSIPKPWPRRSCLLPREIRAARGIP